MNLSAYATVDVAFNFRTKSMKSSSDRFILELSTNGGSTYSLVKEWNFGDEFDNDIWYNELISFAGAALSNNTRLRLVCDGSNNGNHLFIDDIVITVCTEALSLTGHDGSTAPEMKGEAIQNKEGSSREIGNSRIAARLQVKVSPNPFRDELKLFIGKPLPEMKEAIVRVMDVNGRIIYQRFNVPFNEEVNIPLHAGWTNGVYFLRVQASEYIETVRVVKH